MFSYRNALQSAVIARMVCPFFPIIAPTYSLGTNILQIKLNHSQNFDKTFFYLHCCWPPSSFLAFAIVTSITWQMIWIHDLSVRKWSIQKLYALFICRYHTTLKYKRTELALCRYLNGQDFYCCGLPGC